MDIGDIILASQSPRRKALLEQTGMKFKAVSPDVDETVPERLSPRETVALLAERKARSVQGDYAENDVVIGADTVVAYDGMILGKPEHTSDAFQMLTMLSGNWHKVYTGICILQGDKCITRVVRTRVKFTEMSEREIEDYIETGEPADKAGGYAAQGKGAIFIEELEGDYFNVVGLPIHTVFQLLKTEFGYLIFDGE